MNKIQYIFFYEDKNTRRFYMYTFNQGRSIISTSLNLKKKHTFKNHIQKLNFELTNFLPHFSWSALKIIGKT